MNTRFFYLPLFYTIKTRLNGISKQFVAWLFTFLIPFFFLNVYVFMNFAGAGFFSAIYFSLIGLLMTYDAYEIGYIINDAEVIKSEINPTLRLTDCELKYYELSKFKIYLSRLFTLFILFYFVFVFNVGVAVSASIACGLILLIYAVYNSIRSRWNIPIYAVLVYLRYFGLVSFFVGYYNSLILFIIYPLLCLIEFSKKGRFRLHFIQRLPKTDIFRFFYYIAIAPLICWLSITYGIPDIPVAFFALYFFLYRSFSLFVSKSFR